MRKLILDMGSAVSETYASKQALRNDYLEGKRRAVYSVLAREASDGYTERYKAFSK